MTDERMVNLAAALLFEASTAAQAETMRLGAPLDDTQLALVTARAVETTMSVFRREEIAFNFVYSGSPYAANNTEPPR